MLTEDLDMKHVSAKFVPGLLTDDQKIIVSLFVMI